MIILMDFLAVTGLWCIGVGGWITGGIAVGLFLVLLAIIFDPSVRQVSLMLDDLLLDSLGPRRRTARDIDQAIALVCKPCNEGSGRCTCISKCGNWLCGAPDTGIRAWSEEESAYLRGELKEMPRG